MSYHSSSYVYNDLSGLLYNEYADLQLMESTMNDWMKKLHLGVDATVWPRTDKFREEPSARGMGGMK